MVEGQEKLARILYAETKDLRPDPSNPTSLKDLRETLAGMIKGSSCGMGYAAPLAPSALDFGDPDLLNAWQGCVAAAASPRTPPTVTNQAGEALPCNVAFLTSADPRQDAPTRLAHDWIDTIPAPIAQGSALRGGAPAVLYVSAYEKAPGRYPRTGAPVVTVTDTVVRTLSTFTGTLAFLVALALLVGAAVLIGNAGRTLLPGGQGSTALNAHKEAIAARKALDAAVQEYNAQSPPPADGSPLAIRKQQAKEVVDIKEAVLRVFPTYSGLGQWLVAIAGLLGLLGVISYGLRGNVFGFLVDERGRMSLARFQFATWLVTILSSYWIVAFWNIGVSLRPGWEVGPLLPGMESDLWILIGIATGSPLLSGLILDNKAKQAPAPSTGSALPVHVPPQAVAEAGALDVRLVPGTWSFLDLFIGEEVANRSSIDLSRVQQFVFTLVVLLAYLALLSKTISSLPTWGIVPSLPGVDTTLVGLLAISHAAYIAAKALPKSS